MKLNLFSLSWSFEKILLKYTNSKLDIQSLRPLMIRLEAKDFQSKSILGTRTKILLKRERKS